MIRAELPSSVSTEYTPELFGAGTNHFRANGVRITEVHTGRRKAGTSLKSRILHVERPDSQVTTLVMSPGESCQIIEMSKKGNENTLAIGINGSHIKVEVVGNACQTMEQAHYGFDGQKIEPLIIGPTALPTQILPDEVCLLREVGIAIKNPQQNLPAHQVASVSKAFGF